MFRICCSLLFLVLCTNLSAQEKSVPKEMFGKWNYSIENPQTGETIAGTCDVVQKDNLVKANFAMNGNETATTALRPNENGKCYAEITIQDYELGISFVMADNKLMCELDGGSFVLPIEMKKE